MEHGIIDKDKTLCVFLLQMRCAGLPLDRPWALYIKRNGAEEWSFVLIQAIACIYLYTVHIVEYDGQWCRFECVCGGFVCLLLPRLAPQREGGERPQELSERASMLFGCLWSA